MRIRVGLLLLVWFVTQLSIPLAMVPEADAAVATEVIAPHQDVRSSCWSLRSVSTIDAIAIPSASADRAARPWFSRPRLALRRDAAAFIATRRPCRSCYPERRLLQRSGPADSDDPPS